MTPNDLTLAAIEKLMTGPVAYYEPLPLVGVISPLFDHQEAVGVGMDTELIVGLLTILGVVGGGITTAYKILGKIDQNSKDIASMQERVDDFDRRLKPVEKLPDAIDSLVKSMGSQFGYFADLLRTHTENAKEQMDGLKSDIRELRSSVTRRN